MEIRINNRVIAAVKNDSFDLSLSSDAEWIFDLSPEISLIGERAKKAHKNNKKYFIHFDLAEGIGKDRSGILFSKRQGIDGIISTRVNIIKTAREAGLFTVQRFFIVDSHSVDTTLEGIKSAKPDMIEIMPGTVYKVIKNLKDKVNVPIIAGGLVQTSEEAEECFGAGAFAISASKPELWSIFKK